MSASYAAMSAEFDGPPVVRPAELVPGGIAAVAIVARTFAAGGPPEVGIIEGLLVALLVVLATIDLRRRLIPNRLVYAGLVLAFALSVVDGGRGLSSACVGMVVAAAPFVAVFSAAPGGLGGGDVKMAALAGAFVGYPDVLALLVLAALLSAIAAVVVAVRGGRVLALGPVIAVAAVLALL